MSTNIKENHEKYWGTVLELIKLGSAAEASLDDLWAFVTYCEITNKFPKKEYIQPDYGAIVSQGPKPKYESSLVEYCRGKKNLFIEPEIEQADIIIDLGSGWGRNTISLAKKYPHKIIMALEYSDAGQTCTEFIAEKYGLTNIIVSSFDYNNPIALKEVVFPQASFRKTACFVSSHSIEQVPYLGESFMREIISSPFESVSFMHLEPIGWQVQKISKNVNSKYNNDLFPILEFLESDGIINIRKTEVNIFGAKSNNSTKIIWSRS